MMNQVYFLFIVLIWFCSNKFVHGNNDCLTEGKTWSTEGTVYISGQWWFSVGICKYKPGCKSHDLL